jgi:hypothetical protein
MVHRHNQGKLRRPGQLTGQPAALTIAQPPAKTTGLMAVKQQQTPSGQGEACRGQGGPATEDGPDRERVIMISSQQRHRKGQGLQQVPQPDIATPAEVVAEISCDQEQIGGTDLLQCTLNPMTQPGQGGTPMTEACGIGQQMGIAELEKTHRLNGLPGSAGVESAMPAQ